jgi:hypothetical protein
LKTYGVKLVNAGRIYLVPKTNIEVNPLSNATFAPKGFLRTGGPMELQKGIPIANRPVDELVETIDNCFLCGHKLNFIHVTDFRRGQVQEDARCSACGIKQKSHVFVLQ